MHKVTKRALALLLACTLVFSSGMRSRSYAMAGGGVIAGGGAVIGAETALAYLLGILGLSAASAAVYDNRDSIAKWGKTQLTNLSNWVSDRADDLSVTVSSMQSWLEKAGKGTVSTATNEWKALKGWAASQYATGGMVDTVITDQADFPAISDGTYCIGSYAKWRFKNNRDYSDYTTRPDYFVEMIGLGAIFTFTVLDSTGSSPTRRYYQGVVSPDSSTIMKHYKQSYYVADDTPVSDPSSKSIDKLYQYGTGIYARVMQTFGSDVEVSEALHTEWMPNYVGEIKRITTATGEKVDSPGEDEMVVKAYNKYIEGAFNVPKTKVYTETGGISSAYETGKTLENIDVVGVGAKAGATDVTIPWPEDNTFGGLIGGAITGTNTWTDVIDAAGVGVISRENEKDYVIDNTGVTTKEWEYATDIPGTGDIDKPGTDTGDTDADVSKDLSDYTFAGLEKIFPFCLPFDLIDFIGVLDADPEAPKFTIPIKVPTSSGWGVYNIDIDLSKFDSVAALLRQMETLAFVVGLIMITRQKMIRG